jgi:uncharacterized repeat protein (TIGR01451 family)
MNAFVKLAIVIASAVMAAVLIALVLVPASNASGSALDLSDSAHDAQNQTDRHANAGVPVPFGFHLPIGAKLTNVVADPIRPYIYVGNQDTSEILVISVITGSIVKTISIRPIIQSIDISRDFTALYVASSSVKGIEIVNLATQALSGTISLSHAPVSIAAGRLGRAYVAAASPDGFMIVDTDQRIELNYVSVPFDLWGPYALKVNRDGTALYMKTNGTPTSAGKYDVTSDVPSLRWSCEVGQGGGGQNSMDLSPDGTRLYTANGSPYYVRISSTTNCAEVGQLNTGPYPIAIALDISGTVAYASKGSGSVLMFDTTSFSATNNFAVAPSVSEITVAPDRRRLFVVTGDSYNVHEDLWIITPEIQSEKSVNTARVKPGQIVSYLLSVSNTTINAVDPVVLTDRMPLSVTLLPETLHGGAEYVTSANTISWTGSLTGGASLIVTYQALVTTSLSRGARITNSLWISQPFLPGLLTSDVVIAFPYDVFLPIVLR